MIHPPNKVEETQIEEKEKNKQRNKNRAQNQIIHFKTLLRIFQPSQAFSTINHQQLEK
jgi:hypothetical protein